VARTQSESVADNRAGDSGSENDFGGAMLASKVMAALDNSRWPLDNMVEVEVRDHAVYLSGTVKWEHLRMAAQWEVERVPGIHVLRNNIKVRPRCSAGAIESAIGNSLSQNNCDRSHDVRAEVDGAHVTLSGSVCSYTEWLSADHIAKSMPEVESVRNDMAISPDE